MKLLILIMAFVSYRCILLLDSRRLVSAVLILKFKIYSTKSYHARYHDCTVRHASLNIQPQHMSNISSSSNESHHIDVKSLHKIIECTYSHFEQSSQCPICTKNLTENDFTELVVADATTATNDIAKTSLQALFSKQSKGSNHNSHGEEDGSDSKGLPLSDLCFSLVRQIDVVKQSTKFLLKQLLMNSNSNGRKVQHVLRVNEKLKNDVTLLKQGQSSQRLQYEQVHTDLSNRLKARECTIQEMNQKLKEKDRMLDQFRRLHGGGDGRTSTGGSRVGVNFAGARSQQEDDHSTIASHPNPHQHRIPPSNGPLVQRHPNTMHAIHQHEGTRSDPPLKGLVMQRQKQQAAQQQVFNRRRGPNLMSSSGSVQSSITGIGGDSRRLTTNGSNMNMNMNVSEAGDGMSTMGPAVTRPFSSAHSTGSNSLTSVTPRVRDLSHGTAFNFSSRSTGSRGSGGNGAGSSSGGHRLNKRRRMADVTPVANHVMSPNTAFALNQGNHSVNRGQQPRSSSWSGNYSRRG